MPLRVAWILRPEVGNVCHQWLFCLWRVRVLSQTVFLPLCGPDEADNLGSRVVSCTFVGIKQKTEKRGGESGEGKQWVLYSGCGRVVPVNSREILQR